MTKYQKSVNKNKKKQEERVPTPFCWLDIGKSQKLVNKKKEEENKPAPEPFSNLDAFKELIAIENRVSNVLENYEESGSTTSYTNKDVDYVKSLIAKFEENQKQKKAALTAVKDLCRAQLEKFEEFNFEHSLNEIPSELLKDVQHHEFKNAYDAALKSLDKLKSIMSFAAQLSKESEDSFQENSVSDVIAATRGIRSKKRFWTTRVKLANTGERERRASLSLKSDLTDTYFKHITLERANSQLEKEFKTIKEAHHELLLEKEKSIGAISEVNRLKKELIQKHKEVEYLQKSLKTQKQRKFSTVCYNNSSDREALVTQEVKTQDISSNQEKSLPKEKGPLIEATSSTNRCKEEFPATKQSNFSGMPNLSRCSSPACSDDLSSLSSNHDVKVDTHLHGTNNAQVTDFEIKRYQNSHEVKKDIPPSNAMSSVNGDNKRNVKAAVSSQQKTEHKLLDVQLPKEKIKNDASSLQIKPRDLDPVKLPEINLSPGNNHSLSKQLSPSAKIIADLHDKGQLIVDKIKEDQRINEPAHDPSEEELLDQAANVMVEYVNMSQLMNKILKEYCEQENEAYQTGVVLIEEESRNTIIKHYSEFIGNMISTVESVDKEMQRDGIFGGEFFVQALQRQWLNSHCFSIKNQQSKDFISTITKALEMINCNCKLYLEHKKESIVEQKKRLSSLQKMNQQVYQKCIKQLNKISQLPHFIDKSMQKGSQQICRMLEDHIVKVQSAIQTVNYKRELLTMDTKSKIQSFIPEIIKTIHKISSVCAKDGITSLLVVEHDAMVHGLHSSVRKLNKLCISTQIVQRYSTRRDNAIDKAPISFLEQLKSAITGLQDQVKNFISSNLDIQMPDKFDLEVTLKSVYTAVKHSTAVLPPISSRRIQNLKIQSCNEPLQIRRPFVSSHAQRFDEPRHNSVLDPLIHCSPLEAIVQSSNLINGIQGVTICKQMSDNSSMMASKHKRQNINTGRLPKLHINDHGRRKSYPDDMKMTVTINNRSIKKLDKSKKPQPLDCLKIISLSHKSSK